MKKFICVLLSFVLCLGIFTGCTSGNGPENNSNTDNSYIEDESLLLDANILSRYLSLCLDTKTTPEDPEFNFGHFLVRCAIETQKDLNQYIDLIKEVQNIGVTAGASTPDDIINDVIKEIEKI